MKKKGILSTCIILAIAIACAAIAGNSFNKKRDTIPAPDVCAGTFEYKMGKVMAEQILNDAKTKSGKLPKPAQEILCDYVNRECGLKGFCVKVLVDIN